jgi:hypothetical protein
MLHTGSGEILKIRIARDGQLLGVEAAENVLKCLRRLRPLDLVIVQGSINSLRQVLTVDSIDRIGLQELLGAWNSDRWEIFEFKTFSLLDLYIPSISSGGNGGRHSLTGHARSFRYAITPEPDDVFSIFMTDDSDVRMGFLKVLPNKLVITVLDQKNGKVAEVISLSRMRAK